MKDNKILGLLLDRSEQAIKALDECVFPGLAPGGCRSVALISGCFRAAFGVS